MAETHAVRQELVNRSRMQFVQELELFGQVNENMNGILGVSEGVRVGVSVAL